MNVRRYKLVPISEEEREDAVRPGRVRRYGLARVAVSPRSALGVDRHERLERIADLERDGRRDRPAG